MRTYRKSIGLSVIFMALILVLSACGSKILEIPMFDGSIIEVDTNGMTDEQIDMLEKVADGEASFIELMNSNLFSPEEYAEMGLTPGRRLPGDNQRPAGGKDGKNSDSGGDDSGGSNGGN